MASRLFVRTSVLSREQFSPFEKLKKKPTENEKLCLTSRNSNCPKVRELKIGVPVQNFGQTRQDLAPIRQDLG